jgi:AAA15 family ATPase/GTPase
MIQQAIIKNFLNHKEFTVKSFPSITVIIGENDTGKTGILKILYATCKSLEIFSRKSNSIGDVSYKKTLGEKLLNTFQPRKNGIGDIVRKGNKDKFSLDIGFKKEDKMPYQQEIRFSFGETTTQNITDCSEIVKSAPEDFNTLFIPAKEVLTAFKAIKFTREPHYLLGFDDTYLDLIKSLEIPTQKGNVTQELVKVNKDLENLVEGVVNQSDKEDSFLFKKGNTEFSMSLTAEGIKKIGILTTLIRNRQLGKNTILFFDEPETALHPKAIRELVEMLVSISKAGVQIFLSSHSYFIIKQLAICAKRDDIDILCCSLSKDSEDVVISKNANLKEGMPDNPIIEEALKMFDEEISIDIKLGK